MGDDPVAESAARPRLRDRLWTFKAMLLVACATLLVGGLTGAGVVALVGDEDERRGPNVMFEHPGEGPRHPRQHPDERRPWHDPHFYWDDGPTPDLPEVAPDPPDN